MSETKTHYRKAFDSPYLSSADIVEPTVLTIARATLENDKTKKSKDVFNTAYFEERELRPGEKLKPMILNATNSKMLKSITGSPFLEDWVGVKVTVYVDKNVRFGKESVEGLRLSPARVTKPVLSPEKRRHGITLRPPLSAMATLMQCWREWTFLQNIAASLSRSVYHDLARRRAKR